tara:strand:+ start:965 stop:1279 length:315 start_codon:yes stop_codon:yes gene_type:complete
MILTDRETELRDAYLKGYEDKTNYSDKLVVDRYELAERYAVKQAKNNEVLELVSNSLPVICETIGMDGELHINEMSIEFAGGTITELSRKLKIAEDLIKESNDC